MKRNDITTDNDKLLVFTETKFFFELDENERKKIKNGVCLDFSQCANNALANELKYYILDILESKKTSLSTVIYNIGFYKKILYLLPEFNESSFSEMDLELAKGKFIQLCIKNGFNVSMKKTKHSGTAHAVTNEKTSKLVNNFVYIINHYKRKKYSEYKFENDIWFLSSLPFKVEGKIKAASIDSLNFETFHSSSLKECVKKYLIQLFNNKKIKTIAAHLSILKTFDLFLYEIDVNDIQKLTINNLLEYISFIRNSNYSEGVKKGNLSIIKIFFFYARQNSWITIPEKDFLNVDFSYKDVKYNPKYINDFVMEQLLNNMHLMDETSLDITFLLINTGLRISEAAELPINCLKTDSEGDYFIEYYQFKTDEYNKIPIKEELASVILKRIEQTKNKFGSNSSYLFARNKNEPISARLYYSKLRDFCVKYDIKDENGNLFLINPHMFRSTLVTNYINNGMKPDLIRKLIGHSSYDTINHYISIHDSTLVKEMDDILDYQNEMILNIGKNIPFSSTSEDENSEGIPLPNGTCMKPLSEGDCSHLNKCFSCSMFKPSVDDLGVFKKQLIEINNNISLCQQKGFIRMIDKNEEIRSDLIKIIERLEGENYVK